MNRSSLLIGYLKDLGISVEQDKATLLIRFLDELLVWNRRVNLTAITDPNEAIEKHLVDSLTLLPLLKSKDRLLDIGSGGGFPGLPCKVVQPELELLSVDAVQKKINFQWHIIRTLGLKNATALHCRVETLPDAPEWQQGFDVIVSRAFSSLIDFATLALPCLGPGGKIVAMKGPEGTPELANSRQGLAELGLVCTGTTRLELPASGASRCLIVLKRSGV